MITHADYCHERIYGTDRSVRGRPCQMKVAMVDAQGRGWCCRHTPEGKAKQQAKAAAKYAAYTAEMNAKAAVHMARSALLTAAQRWADATPIGPSLSVPEDRLRKAVAAYAAAVQAYPFR